jgi:4-hydroxy-tetrahydrodipicolinate synthase
MEGIWTVIPTIFNHDNDIDFDSMKNIIDKQISSKINGIVINGTTSEISTLNRVEQMDIYENIVKPYNHMIPIMIGVGGNDTSEVYESISICKNICDYIMLTVPYYNKPPQDGLIAHFTHLCNSYPDTKFVIYNIPGRTGVNLEVESLVTILSSCPNVVGIKEASGNIGQIKKTINMTNISVMCGDDSLILPCMSIGCKGVISVISNIVPSDMVMIYRLCKDNNFIEALKIYNNLEHVAETCFITSNPIPLKMILYRLGIVKYQHVRLPLVEPKNDSLIKKINNCVESLSIKYVLK